MAAGFNILYPLIVLAAAGCLYLAVRETSGLPMTWVSFTAPALLAAFIAIVHWGLAPPDMRLRFVVAGALLVGMAGGMVRGREASLQVDHEWHLVRFPHTRDALWVAIALAVAVACDIVLALAALLGDVSVLYHALPLALATLCSALFAGRIAIVALRLKKMPNHDLRWRFLRHAD